MWLQRCYDCDWNPYLDLLLIVFVLVEEEEAAAALSFSSSCATFKCVCALVFCRLAAGMLLEEEDALMMIQAIAREQCE